MKKQKKRLRKEIVQADVALMAVFKTLPGYAPRNPQFSVAAMEQSHNELAQLLHEELLIEMQLAAVRERIVEVGHRYHDQLLGGKHEAVVQFGDDSVEIEALGIKRKSERKQPRRAKKAA
jgi:hypothetical protein